MRIVGTVSIYADGEHTIFSPDLVEKMIGQETKDGDKILNAKQVSPKEILLTVEMNRSFESIIHISKE